MNGDVLALTVVAAVAAAVVTGVPDVPTDTAGVADGFAHLLPANRVDDDGVLLDMLRCGFCCFVSSFFCFFLLLRCDFAVTNPSLSL